MDKAELKDKYNELYQMMSVSKNVSHMRTFGTVTSQMMYWFIENKPEIAENYIEMLCSIKWKQYVTRNEANTICSSMRPSMGWDYDLWARVHEAHKLEIERDFMFNRYALFTVMNSIHSDNGSVVSELMGLGPVDTNNIDYIKAIHKMAINLLCDVDGRYNIRDYYKL